MEFLMSDNTRKKDVTCNVFFLKIKTIKEKLKQKEKELQ